MAETVAADLPAGRCHRLDIVDCQVTVRTDVVIRNIQDAGKPILLHDGEGVGVVVLIGVIEGQDEWVRRKQGALSDCLHELRGRDGRVAPIMQQLEFRLESVGRDVVATADR